MKIAIGSDHAGFAYKQTIKEHLIQNGHQVVDFGTDSDESCDYPDFVHPTAKAVASGECDRGIVLGGSGNGECNGRKQSQKYQMRIVLGYQIGPA